MTSMPDAANRLPPQAGFITLEAIATFAMLCSVLSVAIFATSQALDAGRRATMVRMALDTAESSLDAIGTEEPLAAGQREGISASGYRWQASVERPVPSERGAWVMVAVWGPGADTMGKAPLVTLRTFKLVRAVFR